MKRYGGICMKDIVKSSLAFKLKLLRIEAGKSQEQLANELGISRSCLANYETGNRQPDNDMLIRMADRFSVLTDYLLDRAQYRQLDLTMQEIDEFVQIKYKLKSRGTTLDLSMLDLQGRVAVLQYYDFIETLSQLNYQESQTIGGMNNIE